MSETSPFGREEHLDKPGIIGARWWQRSLTSPADEISRRRALKSVLIGGGVVAGVGLLAVIGNSTTGNDYRYEARGALDMQKEYGWSFGANAEPLTFDGASHQPFDRAALARMVDDFRPGATEHVPFYVPTLFQSPSSSPRTSAPEETTPPVPLSTALTPIFTKAMATAYRRGRALASLFQGTSPAALVIVDLPGPEAVAFAAGASAVLDPVFGFDNWPHPKGVVPAHLTLAAAAYFQPLFARRSRAAARGSTPMLVFDRQRLSPYTDNASQFDNRCTAKVPSAASIKGMGLSRVLYVAPLGTDLELDDLNDDFVAYARAGLTVKLLGADAFGPDANDGAGPPTEGDDEKPYEYYGGNLGSHRWFWQDYPWVTVPADPRGQGPTAPIRKPAGLSYVPVARTTPFSGGSSAARTRPPEFGTVAVVVAAGTGVLLGARLFRSGSWNRSSGGWGG